MVDTDAKKIASFKRGLNPKMMKHVGTNTRARFDDFISVCLEQEKNKNTYTTSKNGLGRVLMQDGRVIAFASC
jgi:hypothetical protein